MDDKAKISNGPNDRPRNDGGNDDAGRGGRGRD